MPFCWTATRDCAAGAFGVGPSGTAPKTVDPSVVDEYGGLLGGVLGLVSRTLIGDMGTTILCVLGIIAGVMLITGASIGAQMRRSAQASAFAARHTASAARRGAETLVRSSVDERRAARARSALGKTKRIVDQETDFSDVGDVISLLINHTVERLGKVDVVRHLISFWLTK